MDEVVKNTHAFVDILCMARGQAVQGWKEDTFHRAFKWAQYFEQVHSKLKSKPALAEKLNTYINNFNKTNQLYLGSLQLSFPLLGKSKELLRKCLLQNPYLSSSQFEHVLQFYDVKIGTQNEAKKLETLQNDMVNIMKQEGTLSVLSQLRDKLTESMLAQQQHEHQKRIENELKNAKEINECAGCPEVYTTPRIATEAGGQLLFKYIQHFLENSDHKDYNQLCEKLGIISNQENGIETITSCLLYLPDDCRLLSKAENVQKFIRNWLLDSLASNPSHSFWSLPLPILSKMSFQYEVILRLYMDRLFMWGNKMIPVLTYQLPIEERQALTHNQVYVWRSPEGFSSDDKSNTFDTLVQHFKCLTNGPTDVQELCYKTIKEIIPDYYKHPSVKDIAKLGINIWQDVYNALSVKM